MAFIDKLKEELDRAGRAAQDALDEGKARIEAFRTRQLADKAAQALGYAVFRAKQSGGEIDPDTYSRLAATLATHDAEAARYEAEIEQKRKEQRSSGATTADSGAATPADVPAPTSPPPASKGTGGKSTSSSGTAGKSTSTSRTGGKSTSSSPTSDAGVSPGTQDVSG